MSKPVKRKCPQCGQVKLFRNGPAVVGMPDDSTLLAALSVAEATGNTTFVAVVQSGHGVSRV